MKLFRRKRRKVTIHPDGSVDLSGYTLAQMMRLSQHPDFRQALWDARENPPPEAEIRDVELGARPPWRAARRDVGFR